MFLNANSAFFKAALIALLGLLMLVPLAQVRGLVSERQMTQERARAGVAVIYGDAQTIGGPVLKIPTRKRVSEFDVNAKNWVERWVDDEPLWILPATLSIAAQQKIQTVRRGIYNFDVYTLPDLTLTGEFDAANIPRLTAEQRKDRELQLSQAVLLLPAGSLNSLRGVQRAQLAGRALHAKGGSFGDLQALQMSVDLTGEAVAAPLPFEFQLMTGGSAALQFLPLAGVTEVELRSNFPHPSFTGNFATLDRQGPNASGFSARWRVLELNRDLPRTWYGEALALDKLQASAFGFALHSPTNVYTMSYRATRYGLLFIAITFLAFFAWEQATRQVQLHGMHYLLVGAALTIFFLLLLALAEHLTFFAAYACAATALVLLIAGYVSGVTARRSAAIVTGTALGLSYGFLYLILQSEDYALLLGSLLIFAVLAVTMLVTRKVRWSQTESSPGK